MFLALSAPISGWEARSAAAEVEPSDPYEVRAREFRRDHPEQACALGLDVVAGVLRLADSVGTRPEFLMAWLTNESGMDPAALNRASMAVGLAQFTPVALRHLGVDRDSVLRATLDDHLDLIRRYLCGVRGDLSDIRVFSMVGFAPSASLAADGQVVFRRGTPEYDQNAWLDSDGGGTITAGEIRANFCRRLRPEAAYYLRNL